MTIENQSKREKKKSKYKREKERERRRSDGVSWSLLDSTTRRHQYILVKMDMKT